MDLFDFSKESSYFREDRWLRFALRLMMVLFVLGVEIIVLTALAKVLIQF